MFLEAGFFTLSQCLRLEVSMITLGHNLHHLPLSVDGVINTKVAFESLLLAVEGAVGDEKV